MRNKPFFERLEARIQINALEKIASIERRRIGEPSWVGKRRSKLDNIDFEMIVTEPHPTVGIIEHQGALTQRLSQANDFLPQARPRLVLASLGPQKARQPITGPDGLGIDSQACDERDRSTAGT